MPTKRNRKIFPSNAMTERPIIFRGESVRAILADRKTQTRRLMKPQPVNALDGPSLDPVSSVWRWDHRNFCRCPYGEPGDRLWVRETWQKCTGCNAGKGLLYRATCDHVPAHPWRSPIHMPRWASRLLLEITEVRAQRVQEIAPEDAIAEGALSDNNGRHRLYGFCLPVDDFWRQSPVDAYMHYWDQINGEGAWFQNEWVWAITFRRVSR